MEFVRLFSNENAKGKQGYLASQKYYEIGRTALYFILSMALFIMGYISTKTRANLLTVLAVLGCLPACKSLVEMIMYLRFSGMELSKAEKIEKMQLPLVQGFDFVFTSYQENYVVDHLIINQNQILGYSGNQKFPEEAFSKHIQNVCKLEGHKELSVKVFTDFEKYTERLKELETKATKSEHHKKEEDLLRILKSVSL